MRSRDLPDPTWPPLELSSSSSSSSALLVLASCSRPRQNISSLRLSGADVSRFGPAPAAPVARRQRSSVCALTRLSRRGGGAAGGATFDLSLRLSSQTELPPVGSPPPPLAAARQRSGVRARNPEPPSCPAPSERPQEDGGGKGAMEGGV